MFSIERKLVKIKSATTVAEFKGDKRDHGQSVKVEIMVDNTVLDELFPGLREAFYERDSGKAKNADTGQGELPVPRQDLALTSRKLILVNTPIKLKNEMAGYTLIYHFGATDKSEVMLNDVALSDFTVDPHDGGSCALGFAMYSKPTTDVQGKVDHCTQTEIEITLTPPTEAQVSLPLDKPGKTQKKRGTDPFAGSDLAKDGSKIEA